MLLRVAPLSFADGCPATVPNGSTPRLYGNGLLWTGFAPNREFGVSQEDGSYFDKFLWMTIVYAPLTVRAVRLDATASPAQWKANEGTSAGSWATAVSFASAGCWRLTARVADVSLSVVVRVGPP
jgi:hypothetical protein